MMAGTPQRNKLCSVLWWNTRIPQNTTAITDPETLEKINKLLDALDDMDDVQNVYHNGELPEEEEEDD